MTNSGVRRWSPALFNATHIFSLGGYYDVPHMTGPGNAILGGWALNYVASLHSGFPITIQANDVSNQAVRGGTRADRFLPLTYTGGSKASTNGSGLETRIA